MQPARPNSAQVGGGTEQCEASWNCPLTRADRLAASHNIICGPWLLKPWRGKGVAMSVRIRADINPSKRSGFATPSGREERAWRPRSPGGPAETPRRSRTGFNNHHARLASWRYTIALIVPAFMHPHVLISFAISQPLPPGSSAALGECFNQFQRWASLRNG